MSTLLQQQSILDPKLGMEAILETTRQELYPMQDLYYLRTSRKLSPNEWRQVGNHQKTLWLNRLYKRIGNAPADSIVPVFEFDNFDWSNVFQLEAIVELYANYDDPWASDVIPRYFDDPEYITIDFLEPAGIAATANDKFVTLDGNLDLSKVQPGYDSIYLENDTFRVSRMYQILEVDTNAQTIKLDSSPILTSETSAWQIKQQPTIVIIDPFGSRIAGERATVDNTNVVKLSAPIPALSKINANFDTIYLPSDTARSTRTYRIVAVNDAIPALTLDGNPILDGGSSPWSIQAGVNGELPSVNYDLGPGGSRGYDHLDGAAFVIKNGRVRDRFSWTSYTSRNYETGDESLSSVRGNKCYDISSFYSSNAFRNYSFKLTDRGATYDGVCEARFYFSKPVLPDNTPFGTTPDIRGKTHIRLHYSRIHKPSDGIDSAGCLVSPMFNDFRTLMIELYQEDYRAVNGVYDSKLQKLWGCDQAQSEMFWTNTNQKIGKAADWLTAQDWKDKLKATLWLIRPDELPLG